MNFYFLFPFKYLLTRRPSISSKTVKVQTNPLNSISNHWGLFFRSDLHTLSYKSLYKKLEQAPTYNNKIFFAVNIFYDWYPPTIFTSNNHDSVSNSKQMW